MAVSRILSSEFLRSDDHLSQSRFRGTARYACAYRDATIPEDHNGPAVLPLFCLAPHGVFRASRITSRAVSSYLAFSPLPALKKEQLFFQRTGGVFSVTLSVNVRLRERCPRILRGMLPYGVRTFLQQILRLTSDHLPSADRLAQSGQSGSQGTKKESLRNRNE